MFEPNNCCRIYTAEWLFEQGKKWINESNMGNIDFTAKLFFRLLMDLQRDDLAERLYDYYERVLG